MKAIKLSLAILFLLAILACGAIGSAPTQPPLPTSTSTPIPPTPIPPTATVTPIPPTPTPEFLQYYTEEFDKDLKYWPSYVIDGYNGVMMKEPDVKLEIADGSISFDLAKWRWVYATYDPFEYEDVHVEAQAENLGTNNNNVSLTCRYSKQGWYEFNVANNGLYWIYNASVRDDGFVKYKLLEQGGSNKIVQGNTPGKNLNIYGIICKGDTLTLYINDTMTKEVKDATLRSGKIGVSISSFDTAANVRFNWVKISEP